MSSGVDSGGIIAAAVVLPLSIVYGVGWLAWQSGKLLIETNNDLDKKIAAKKLQRKNEEAAMHRKRLALATRSQLVDMSSQLLNKIDENSSFTKGINFTEIEQLKKKLHDIICCDNLPNDVIEIEKLNSHNWEILEEVIEKQQYLANLALNEEMGMYQGLSLAELMDNLKIAISAMTIQATDGKDVNIADPVVRERIELNKKLSIVTEQIMDAVQYVSELTNMYGLLQSNRKSLDSCFNGIDEQIQRLYMPAVTNRELINGIKRLKDSLNIYNGIIPTIENEQKRFSSLYQIYVETSRALGEPIQSIKSFNNLENLEKSLSQLKERSKKAYECAKIYEKLGRTAYICYAWDQELQAIGYSVYKRKDIAEIAKFKPQHACLEKKTLPFYHWNKQDLTQLYSMTEECSLQLIVHEDGTVTMQTISDSDNVKKTKEVQTRHCNLLSQLHENLRKNWFIIYDYQETVSPNTITSIREWFNSEQSTWKYTLDITEQRKKGKNQNRFKQSQ